MQLKSKVRFEDQQLVEAANQLQVYMNDLSRSLPRQGTNSSLMMSGEKGHNTMSPFEKKLQAY